MAPRRPISYEQKQALREQRLQQPRASNLELQQWFEATYNRSISTSSVSDILGSRFKYLDGSSRRPAATKRVRAEQWPDLEEALYQWVRRAEDTIPITGELLKQKAQFFWQNLSVYQGKPMPTFSNGWLQGFQHRRSIKSRTQHGEAGSVPEEAEQQMVAIRQALAHYPTKDIYNCDESGLFWKLIPDKGLSTYSLPGRKKVKVRLTAHFCTNADGSDRLPIWIIGKAKKPRSFAAAGVNIQHLNIVYRNNKTAWMTNTIFEEFLRWFDIRMRGRKVVLLMDNFSAHELAVENITQSQRPLENTLIIWLPANSTSRYQPLDQGIIASWKLHWKRQWLRFLMDEFDAGRDPISRMDILKAIRWSIPAWEIDVQSTTISNCFQKGLFRQTYSVSTNPIEAEIRYGLQRLEEARFIQEAMDINNFLNPAEESVQDDIDQVEQQIIAQFEPNDQESEEEELEITPLITVQEALEGLQKLRLFQEQSAGDTALISHLNRHERELKSRREATLEQQDIRNFFT